MINIIDYGMGNLGSVRNMLARVGAESTITSDPDDVAVATKLILPGVGSFDHAMQRLKLLDLLPVLREKVLSEGIPILGLCLGMQLLTNRSEEGELPGLGWIDAQTRRFDVSDGLPVPHMGWNTVEASAQAGILTDLPEQSRFYFVHSYYVECESEYTVLGTTEYGTRFHSAIGRDNILGLQFHPEKSHRYGQLLLRRFNEL
jgi:glutamine amidotransferase